MVRAPTHLSPSHHMQCIGRAWPQHRSSSSSALLQLPLLRQHSRSSCRWRQLPARTCPQQHMGSCMSQEQLLRQHSRSRCRSNKGLPGNAAEVSRGSTTHRAGQGTDSSSRARDARVRSGSSRCRQPCCQAAWGQREGSAAKGRPAKKSRAEDGCQQGPIAPNTQQVATLPDTALLPGAQSARLLATTRSVTVAEFAARKMMGSAASRFHAAIRMAASNDRFKCTSAPLQMPWQGHCLGWRK